MIWTATRDILLAVLFAAFAGVHAWSASDACLLLTQKQVSDALGAQVDSGKPLVPSNPAICVWTAPGEARKGDKRLTLSLYMQQGSRSPMDRFNTAKTPVSGIGDEAFYSTAGGISGLVVRKGNTPFHVEVRGFSANEVKQKEKTLAEEVLAKL